MRNQKIKNLLSSFLVILFFSFSSYCQGRKSLDNDYGIGQFKLNTDIKLYQKKIKYFWVDKKGTEFYEYTFGDVKSLFGKKVNNIHLAFINNKLYSITINFGTINTDEKWELLDILQKKYDTPEMIHPENHLNYVAAWETGKVIMQLEEYSCSSPAFQCETELFMNSKALAKLVE